MRFWVLLGVLLVLSIGAWSRAALMEDEPLYRTTEGGAAQAHRENAAEEPPHPIIPAPATWAGVVVIGILAMFLAAVSVGVAVRANAAEEVPVAHSHDEPPGASHHHGAGGTIDSGHRHEH